MNSYLPLSFYNSTSARNVCTYIERAELSHHLPSVSECVWPKVTVHSLFTVHCSLFIHCSLFTVHCSFTVHSLFTVHCSLFTVHCSLFTVHSFIHFLTFFLTFLTFLHSFLLYSCRIHFLSGGGMSARTLSAATAAPSEN